MGFKEAIKTDIESVFINFEEFASKHTIDGNELDIVVDEDTMQYRNDKNGAQIGNVLFFAKEQDFEVRPEPDQNMVFDGHSMHVTDCTGDMGVLSISLRDNFR